MQARLLLGLSLLTSACSTLPSVHDRTLPHTFNASPTYQRPAPSSAEALRERYYRFNKIGFDGEDLFAGRRRVSLDGMTAYLDRLPLNGLQAGFKGRVERLGIARTADTIQRNFFGGPWVRDIVALGNLFTVADLEAQVQRMNQALAMDLGASPPKEGLSSAPPLPEKLLDLKPGDPVLAAFPTDWELSGAEGLRVGGIRVTEAQAIEHMRRSGDEASAAHFDHGVGSVIHGELLGVGGLILFFTGLFGGIATQGHESWPGALMLVSLPMGVAAPFMISSGDKEKADAIVSFDLTLKWPAKRSGR